MAGAKGIARAQKVTGMKGRIKEQAKEIKSLEQTVELAQHTINEMHGQNRSLMKALSHAVLANGGEIRVTREQQEIELVGKKLESRIDEETGEYIFQVIDIPDEIPGEVEENSATEVESATAE